MFCYVITLCSVITLRIDNYTKTQKPFPTISWVQSVAWKIISKNWEISQLAVNIRLFIFLNFHLQAYTWVIRHKLECVYMCNHHLQDSVVQM